jgi:hypothetical protein
MTTNEKAQNAVLAWISDPGHAWLAVTLDDESGFPDAAKFASEYSYYDLAGDNFAGIVFLEEDDDAPRFAKEYGIDLRHVQETHFDNHEHFVRKLPRYSA